MLCYKCKYKGNIIIANFGYYNAGLQSCKRCQLTYILGSMRSEAQGDSVVDIFPLA